MLCNEMKLKFIYYIDSNLWVLIVIFCIKGLLLSCSSSPNMEICAMATVNLHTILQTSNRCIVEVECYLLRSANSIMQKALKGKLY